MKEDAFIGISCTGHDGAIAVIEGGRLVFAEAAERYRQNKFAVGQAPDDYHYCQMLLEKYVEQDGIVVAKTWSEDANEIWRNENIALRKALDDFPDYRAVISQLVHLHSSSWENFMRPSIELAGYGLRRAASAVGKTVTATHSFDHHLCHAAFGAWSAPFDSAAVVVMDGQGEGAGTQFWHYRNGDLQPVEKEPYTGSLVRCYESLGLYYGILVCLACGFEPVSGEEWKIMGLAPYGSIDEGLYKKLKSFYSVNGLSVNCTERSVEIFMELVTHPVNHKTDFRKAANYAHTFQRFYSDIATELIAEIGRRTGEDNLIIAGGCGLNSSFNGRIVETTAFSNVFVPCAPADDGNAAGAAVLASMQYEPVCSRKFPRRSSPQSAYLGSEVDMASLENILANNPYLPRKEFDDEEGLVREVASRLARGEVIGWVRGRAEFGPRALGNRSILADPRKAEMKNKVNAVVKFREAFRPFAPSMCHEAGDSWFENYQDTPYMERTLKFIPSMGERVPAVYHEDGTARVQSVTEDRNPTFYNLIKEFGRITGVPMILNTSLNVMGKPIVHSVEDALLVFLGSKMDCIVIGHMLIEKQSVLPDSLRTIMEEEALA